METNKDHSAQYIKINHYTDVAVSQTRMHRSLNSCKGMVLWSTGLAYVWV